jgi:hypothetical protein
MASRGHKVLLERLGRKAHLGRLDHKVLKGLPVKTDATAKTALLDRKAHKAHKVLKALPVRLALTAKTAMALRAPILPLTAR